MSKPKRERALSDQEAIAQGTMIRTSPRKLNVVAGLIRGLPAGKAVAQLTFSRRRVAGEVRKVLEAAIANAENNHALDVDRLVVTEASVGKALVMKRFHARARGRASSIQKPFSNLRIVVRQQEEAA
ncbi:50S ribosomal protein L22 [Marinivivus vitaminiproducens]|uniref:50S ribosomal protein L22 n=1 Tax=Marinivivus vitaminiproducens TaxID=3035935 RepID=UPI0027A41F6E|nr:50S ribosomal protein L22 [Geminicoccaceae bacterium SCSIO 64248]